MTRMEHEQCMKHNNPHNLNNQELSDEELLSMVDGGTEMTHGYDALLSHITTAKAEMVPSTAFVEKMLAALPTPGAASVREHMPVTPGIKSPFGERFAWFGSAMVSPWKIATPIAVVLLVFGVVIGRNNSRESQVPVAAPMAFQIESASMPTASDARNSAADSAGGVAPQARMMMTASKVAPKAAPVPSSASAVVAMLSSEADGDADDNSSADVNLLSIDPASVNDLKQTYDATTN